MLRIRSYLTRLQLNFCVSRNLTLSPLIQSLDIVSKLAGEAIIPNPASPRSSQSSASGRRWDGTR
jgi:hypothetical protein